MKKKDKIKELKTIIKEYQKIIEGTEGFYGLIEMAKAWNEFEDDLNKLKERVKNV